MQRGLGNRPKESTAMTVELAEEDEQEDYNNNNVGIGGG